jgi:hypothetical protein
MADENKGASPDNASAAAAPAEVTDQQIVDAVRDMAEKIGGQDAVARICAAAHEVGGLSTGDAQRMVTLLRAPRNEEETTARCVDIITNAQGPDTMRRNVVRSLLAAFGA